MLCKVVLTFVSLDELPKSPQNESHIGLYCELRSFCAVNYAVRCQVLFETHIKTATIQILLFQVITRIDYNEKKKRKKKNNNNNNNNYNKNSKEKTTGEFYFSSRFSLLFFIFITVAYCLSLWMKTP